MTKIIAMRWKSSGNIDYYPEDYLDHPQFGYDLEIYDPSEEYEEDKVVSEGHELPVDQRITIVAKPAKAADKDDEEN